MCRGPLLAVVAAALWLGGTPGLAAARALVYTVNYPLAYFAERLAPEGTEVVFPAPPDVDPPSPAPAC